MCIVRCFCLVLCVAIAHAQVCEECTRIPVEYIYPPTSAPTPMPIASDFPTSSPTFLPTSFPTDVPTTLSPTSLPTTLSPTPLPTTLSPTSLPTTLKPTPNPTSNPTTLSPTSLPTTLKPTPNPTSNPTTLSPTSLPTTLKPTPNPTSNPTTPNPTTPNPTSVPTSQPTLLPYTFLSEPNFGSCIESTGTLTCSTSTWSITDNTNTDVINFLGVVSMHITAAIEITVDVSPFDTINSFSLDLTTTGTFEPDDYCYLSYAVNGGALTEVLEVRQATQGLTNSGRQTIEVGFIDIIAPNTLTIRIGASTSAVGEYCDIFSFNAIATPNPNTRAPTSQPTRMPTFAAVDLVNSNLGQCIKSGSVDLICPTISWVISVTSNAEVITTQSNRVQLRRNARITATLDIASYSSIDSLTVSVGTSGSLDANEFCRLYTQIDSAPQVEFTSVRTYTNDGNGLALQSFTKTNFGSGSTLRVIIEGISNLSTEYCDVGTLVIRATPNVAPTAAPTTQFTCVNQFDQCGGSNLCGTDSQCRSCCYSGGVCQRSNAFYWQVSNFVFF